MSHARTISVILPSFRDARILTAIASIRMFDDISAVRIIVIDGGSDDPLVQSIKNALTDDDILVSEPDLGIFDALNKGLERVSTPYVGWLGSDDLYSGQVLASEVVGELETSELFISSLILFRGDRVRRLTHSLPSSWGLARFGLHNPHFATFGRADLLCKFRFEVGNISADIEYFLEVFMEKPQVASTNRIGLLQGDGGFSTQSFKHSINVNRSVYHIYTKRSIRVVAAASVLIKVGYKLASLAYYKVRRTRWPSQFPLAYKLMLSPQSEA
jgi:glycosyltransferase